jgi:putative metallohydrolase (TIGR04338 family)
LRDNQRSKLYGAQAVLEPYKDPLPTVAAVEDYVRRVWQSKVLKRTYLRAMLRASEPRVRDGRGTRIARGGPNSINIPLWARNTRVVLHELAHTIIAREYPAREPAPHGWEYCAVYLKLVQTMMGTEAAAALKASMRAERVRFTEPRKRAPMSAERKQELRAQLVRAREAKLSV